VLKGFLEKGRALQRVVRGTHVIVDRTSMFVENVMELDQEALCNKTCVHVWDSRSRLKASSRECTLLFPEETALRIFRCAAHNTKLALAQLENEMHKPKTASCLWTRQQAQKFVKLLQANKGGFKGIAEALSRPLPEVLEFYYGQYLQCKAQRYAERYGRGYKNEDELEEVQIEMEGFAERYPDEEQRLLDASYDEECTSDVYSVEDD
jgi:hypothetical protein